MSAIIGATLLYKKLRGKTTLLAWISLGSVACVVSAALSPETNSINLVFVSLILGAFAGLGIPTCLAFFAENSNSKNRGRMATVLFFLIQLLTFLIYIPISGTDVYYQFLVLAGWRFLGVASIFFFVPREGLSEERLTPLSSIIRERTFVLYFVPWFLFTLVNFVENALLEHYFGAELFGTYMVAALLIASVSAFLGGAICDFKGRKVSGVLGFILLGLGYGFLSLFPGTQISQILYVLFDGVAWGILYVTFIFVIWGDISEGKAHERYYLLGCMPFLLSNMIEALVRPFAEFIQIATSFSLASLFLFVAVLPLLYAPETLSEKIMKDRELKNYIEKAKREVAKAQEKDQDKAEKECEHEKAEQDDVEFEVGEENMEEAEALAEKYY